LRTGRGFLPGARQGGLVPLWQTILVRAGPGRDGPAPTPAVGL